MIYLLAFLVSCTLGFILLVHVTAEVEDAYRAADEPMVVREAARIVEEAWR